ncbi:MAG: hypothetical protein QG666_1197, partial [Euryarchaeota archaeon]|nr:hypothetical protein [Euryarchaeota archaeon]
MNRQLLIPLFLMTILQLVSNSVAENVSSLEIHGMVATDTATWTADNFAGFYYDLDD